MPGANFALNSHNGTLAFVKDGQRYVVDDDDYDDYDDEEDREDSFWELIDEYMLGDFSDTHVCTGSEWITHDGWNNLTPEQVAEMKRAGMLRLKARLEKFIAERDHA